MMVQNQKIKKHAMALFDKFDDWRNSVLYYAHKKRADHVNAFAASKKNTMTSFVTTSGCYMTAPILIVRTGYIIKKDLDLPIMVVTNQKLFQD